MNLPTLPTDPETRDELAAVLRATRPLLIVIATASVLVIGIRTVEFVQWLF